MPYIRVANRAGTRAAPSQIGDVPRKYFIVSLHII